MKFRFLWQGLAAVFLASSATASPGGYLFVTFKNGSTPQSEQIYFGLSQDGQTWTALNESKPVVVSTVGEKGARDPFILRSHDGSKFYLIATDLSIYYNADWTRAAQAGSHSIVVWESSDLVNWSQPRLVAVAASDAGCTWGPEAIYDDSTGDYLVSWASTSASDSYAKQRIWASRTTDFRTFSTPFIYVDKTNSVIDADIVRDGSHFYRFTKDETNKVIAMETSDQLMGTWTAVPGFTLSSMQGYQGPECYQLPNGNWCLVADHYSTGTGYAPFVTSSLATGSFAAGTGFSFPFSFRHGAVLPISTDEYGRLAAAFQSSSRIVIHLPFNEITGTTSADVTGHAWNATLVNGASRVAGKGGNAVSLSGSSQYVSLPAGAVYSLTDFTISAWVKINALATWSRIFDFGTGTTNYMFLTPKAGGTGNVRFAIAASGSGEQQINGTAPLSTGVWTHVAVSVQGSVGILYVNGVEVGRNTSMIKNPSLLNVTTQNWLGRSQFSADPYLNGQIDDFRVYSSGLSASAIQALYADGAPGVLASPWLDQDLGAPSLAGSAATGEGGSTAISGAGTGILGTADQGHFVYQSWTGDGILTARLNTVSANASLIGNAGLMIRKDLTNSAPSIYLGMTRTGALSWQHRDTAGGATTATTASTTPASPWLRITRSGNVFTAYTSPDGSTWTQVGSPVTLALPLAIQVGMAISSGSSTALEAAQFTSASITTSPPPSAPSGLSAVASGSNIQLSWTGVPGATSYTVKRSTSFGGTYAAIASGIATTSYVDSPTADGTTYYYVITASNSGGEGAASPVAWVTLYSDYQQWKMASGLYLNIPDSATPGSDGASVLLKYAIGAAPGAPVSAPYQMVTTPSRGISFTRLSPARANFVVQASSDLITWTDIASLVYGSDTWTGTGRVTEDTTVTPRRVTVLDDSSFASAPKRFFRLSVTNGDPAPTVNVGDRAIVQTKFTADPAPLVYNGVVYLFAGHDEDNANGFLMLDWQCYSSTDMVNWTDRGTIASLKTFPWANQSNGAWASQMIARNGKFYFYAAVFAPNNTIGVAVSDSPTGPFVDALGGPLVGGPSGVTGYIDPTVFIDDDGQAYLYWGNPNLWYAKLNNDMISLSGGIVQDPSINSSFHYQEGPWAYKRNGHYYMAYASTAPPEGIGYAMSNSPTGPWQPEGYIMKPDSRSSGNHPGIIDYRGKSYVFGFDYDLNFALTSTSRQRRCVCVAEVQYNADGTIRQIPWWDDGKAVQQIGTLNPYARTEAETICWSQDLKSEPSSQGGMCVYPLDSNAFIEVQGVDFGTGAKNFTASLASSSSGGVIEIHLDSPTGPIIGICAVPNTGGTTTWTTSTCQVQNAIGMHDLYFLFPNGGSPRFDWWQFQ